jgi:hypothetical protein
MRNDKNENDKIGLTCFIILTMVLGTRLTPLHHPLLDHLRWIAGAAGGGLKLLFAHFVLVLEALFGGHLLEALARLSLGQPADKLKYDSADYTQCHNASNNYH